MESDILSKLSKKLITILVQIYKFMTWANYLKYKRMVSIWMYLIKINLNSFDKYKKIIWRIFLYWVFF